MLDPNSDTVLRWTCPSCYVEWLDRGRGFHGQRFSSCLGCGTDACEPVDTRPALAPRPLYALSSSAH
ncbi:MAG TPA: hypothetical protein VGG41_15590 [Solirubrobacteraceae bacterium]